MTKKLQEMLGEFTTHRISQILSIKNYLRWCGFPEVADEIWAGWAAKDRERTTNAFSDELVDEIGCIGTEAEVRERFKEMAEMGITTNICAPFGPPDREVFFPNV
ncbi:MAG: hypothetical protein CM1200mP24_09380 [Gammaproteobacteria bacterium]|nr:MAG: hypothetical protein CM1200mP24_09380 [Gammaproteobacteria bacterium]